MCFKPKRQLISLVERSQKTVQGFIFLVSVKGIKCEKNIKSNMQSGLHRTEGKWCLNSPILASHSVSWCSAGSCEQSRVWICQGHMLSIYGLLLLYKHLFIPTQENDFGNNYSQGLCLYWWVDQWFFSITRTVIVVREHELSIDTMCLLG